MVHYANTYGSWDHGTRVAGIAAGDYGSLSGIAKGVNIIAVKIFSKFTAGDCDGSPCIMCWNSDTIAGLEYVYSLRTSYNIAAVNLSLDGGRYGAAGVSALMGRRFVLDCRLKYSACKMKPADFGIDVGGLSVSLGAGVRF